MPRIWIDYCQFLVDQCKVTRSRRTFDRALRALPITQHRRIWPIYLKFVRKYHIPETAVRVYRRYLKVGADIYIFCTRILRSIYGSLSKNFFFGVWRPIELPVSSWVEGGLN